MITATLLHSTRVKPFVTQWVIIIMLSIILAVFVQVSNGTINMDTMSTAWKAITGAIILALIYHTGMQYSKMHISLTILAGIIFFIAILAIANSNPDIA